jgi:hypothetical protein
MKRLEPLEGEAWRELVAAPIAVIVLAKSTCPVCRAWSEELATFLERDQRWKGVRFGEIFIYESSTPVEEEEEEEEEEDGTPGAIFRALSTQRSAMGGPRGSFAQANREWLDEVEDLPHNVLYVKGKRVKSWPGAGIERLVTRLEGIPRT